MHCYSVSSTLLTAGAKPGFYVEGTEAERRRHVKRGAEGAEEGWYWGGGVLFPPNPLIDY